MSSALRPVLLAALLSLAVAAPASANTLVDQSSPDANYSSSASDGPGGYHGETADDFSVPDGSQWTVTEVDVTGSGYGGRASQTVIVRFYDDAGGLPGTETYRQTADMSTINPDFAIALASPAVLGAGTHWLSVQATGTGGSDGEWFWEDRTTQSGNPAAFRAPSPAACTAWTVRSSCQGGTGPDQLFKLQGTSGAAPGGSPPPATTTDTTSPPPPPATTTSGPAPAPTPTSAPKPTATQVISLPSSTKCASKRTLVVHLKTPKGVQLTRAVLTVNGKSPKTVTGTKLAAPVDLRGLPKGTYKVKIVVTLAGGTTVTASRTYKTCAAKHRH